MSDIIYMAYACMHRDYYEEDNLPGSDSEYVVDVDTDKDALRERLNAHYATDEQVRGHRGTALFIAPNAYRSNTWHNSGGGCFASGYIEIRQAPRLGDKS